MGLALHRGRVDGGFSMRLLVRQLLGLLLLYSVGTEGTCPHFGAWLKPVDNIVFNNLEGFVTLQVAPDAESVVVTVQITALPFSSAIPQFLPIEILGPARSFEVVPDGTTALLTLPQPTIDQTVTSVFTATYRRSAADMTTFMTHLREGMTYVSVKTDRVPTGELRGQLTVGKCLEAPLMAAPGMPNMHAYGFVNVMVKDDESAIAVLAQLPSDKKRALSASPNNITLMNGGALLATLQPQSYESCVLGTFDGRKLDGSTCNFGERHVYPAEINMANAAAKVWHIVNPVGANVVSGLTSQAAQAYVGTPTSMGMGMQGEIHGVLMTAISCRLLLGVHDNLYTMATSHRSDWLTVWSMNDANPDVRPTLVPKYFGHPYEILKGETALAITRRYGMQREEILKLNPGLADIDNLPVGSQLCIVPDWNLVVAGNGQRVCVAS